MDFPQREYRDLLELRRGLSRHEQDA